MDGPPSASLAARQECLMRWHVDQQQGNLAKLGLAAVNSGRTPRGPPSRAAAIAHTSARGSAACSAAASPRVLATPVAPAAAPLGTTASTLGTPATPLGAALWPGSRPLSEQAAHAFARRRDPRLRGVDSAPAMAPGLDLLIDGLRRRLQQQGLAAHVQLEGIFKEMNTDGTGVLSTSEFRKGLRHFGLLQSDGECDLIFAYFDADRSGGIDFYEFLDALRGQLPEARREVVQEAFTSLDVNGDGVLSLEDLRLKFRSYAHPDVRNGSRTEEQVFMDFIDCFDIICRDGQVTITEFERYYEYLSALIVTDELFIATVRNAWHLPKATGGSCLRLAIKRSAKGTSRAQRDFRGPNDPRQRGFHSGIGQVIQEAVEIRPDLGVHVHDPGFTSAVRARLEQMGYHDVDEFEVLGRQ